MKGAHKIAKRAEDAVKEVEKMEAYTCYTHQSPSSSPGAACDPPKRAGQEYGSEPWPEGELKVTSSKVPQAHVFWTKFSFSSGNHHQKKQKLLAAHSGKRIVLVNETNSSEEPTNPIRHAGKQGYKFQLDIHSEAKACYYCDCAGFVRGILAYFSKIPDFALLANHDNKRHLVIPESSLKIGGHKKELPFVRAFDIAFHFSQKNHHFEQNKHWQRIECTEDIERGDIVAYGCKRDIVVDGKQKRSTHTGHVWIALSDVALDGTYMIAESSSTYCGMLNAKLGGRTSHAYDRDAKEAFKRTRLYQETGCMSTFGVRRNKCRHDEEPHRGRKLDDERYFCFGIARYLGEA